MFNGFELPDQRLKSFHARALAFETLWSISGSGRSPRCGLMPKCRHHVCCREAALAGESASWAFEPCNRNWLCRNRRTRATRPLAGMEMGVQTLTFLMCGKREESALPSLPRNSKKRFPRPSSLRSCRIDTKRQGVLTSTYRRVIPLRFLLLPPTLPVLAGRAGGQVGLPSAPDWSGKEKCRLKERFHE